MLEIEELEAGLRRAVVVLDVKALSLSRTQRLEQITGWTKWRGAWAGHSCLHCSWRPCGPEGVAGAILRLTRWKRQFPDLQMRYASGQPGG